MTVIAVINNYIILLIRIIIICIALLRPICLHYAENLEEDVLNF